DRNVTGVQTCALPIFAANRYGIYFGGSLAASTKGSIRGNTVTRAGTNGIQVAGVSALARTSSLVIEGNLCYANGENGIYLKSVRSEERRVGKEGRCRR